MITDHQLPLITLCFLAGLIGTALIYRRPAQSRAWKLADLVWVVLGGFGALAAVMAGIYKTDSSRIDRQIDVAYAASRAFDSDAARFRLRYCEGSVAPAVRTLCDKVEFLSASTAGNAELPLFIAITESVAPLQGLHFFFGTPSATDMDLRGMVDEANAFDPAPFLAFTTQDDSIRAAMAALRHARPAVAADYQILATAYDDLIEEVGRLKSEWEVLESNSGILILQIIALCMVAFAAPFRLGKSLVEMRSSSRNRP